MMVLQQGSDVIYFVLFMIDLWVQLNIIMYPIHLVMWIDWFFVGCAAGSDYVYDTLSNTK